MIFLDTSALYALADNDDAKHEEGLQVFTSLLAAGEDFTTHSYVIVESAALIHRRLGLQPALAFLNDVERFNVCWVSEDLHRAAVQELARRGRSKLSLVDVVSFILMGEMNISTYFGFDDHFLSEGFQRAGIT